MKTLYLDCFAGIAGDMFIGALLNLVHDPEILTREISKIHSIDDEYEILIEHTTRNGIAGINFDVRVFHGDEHSHGHEHATEHAHAHELSLIHI